MKAGIKLPGLSLPATIPAAGIDVFDSYRKPDPIQVVGIPEALGRGTSLVLLINRACFINDHGFCYLFFRNAPTFSQLRKFARENATSKIFLAYPLLIDTGERFETDEAAAARATKLKDSLNSVNVIWPPLTIEKAKH